MEYCREVFLMEVNVELRDAFGITYDTEITDSNGQAILIGTLPDDYSPYLNRPDVILQLGIDGFLVGPDEATIIHSDNKRIQLDLPYVSPQRKPNNQKTG